MTHDQSILRSLPRELIDMVVSYLSSAEMKISRFISHEFNDIVKPTVFSHLHLQGAQNENQRAISTSVQFSDLKEIVDELSSMSFLPMVKTLEFIPAFYKQGLSVDKLFPIEIV